MVEIIKQDNIHTKKEDKYSLLQYESAKYLYL